MMEETSLRDIRFVRGRRGEGDELEIEKAILPNVNLSKSPLVHICYFM